MSFWNPFSWFGGSSKDEAGAALAAGPVDYSAAGPVDYSEFMRSSWTLPTISAQDLISLGSVAMGCTPNTPPQHVHASVIDAMGFHPMIYMGESMVSGPATDPELYFLRGEDRFCSEVEVWLRPLLAGQRAPLLNAIVRGVALGSVPIVLDYGERDLSIKVPSKDGETRNRNLPGHVHFVASHEVWPGDAQLRVKGDRLLGVVAPGGEIGGEDLEPGKARAFLSLWDPRPGACAEEYWQGQGSRRRAYKDWIEEGAARLWEIRAIERGVDLPRVGYAPEGKLKINGQEIDAIKLLRAQIMSLRNGSALVLPNTLLADNATQAFQVKVLETTVQHQLLNYAIDSRGKRMLLASLAPSTLDKATEEQFMDSVQRVCDFSARTLTRVVNVALRLRYSDSAPFVQVVANDIPKRKLRVALEVFRAVASHVQHLPDGRVVTIGEMVDGPEILKQIGIFNRPMDEAAHKPTPAPPAGGPVGRPTDTAGGREERRDSARTVEGEEDTGGEDVEREERE